MKKYPILTVIYHETKEHYQMALKTWDSFPKECEIYAVINKKLDGVEYPDWITYIENDENCLARAWNIGLKHIFSKWQPIGDLSDYRYCYVSGLDSISPTIEELEEMEDNLDFAYHGVVSANCTNTSDVLNVPITHGDGSFSFFGIRKECFEDVGDFDERYKPAYFEDNDYLERMWEKGYKPIKMNDIKYYHVFQGTVKGGGEIRKEYPRFMQKNLELFKKTYGKVPDHLPSDISFTFRFRPCRVTYLFNFIA